jgi:hypothetical protein
METDHTEALHSAAADYRKAHEDAEKILRPARERLADTIRAAYSDGMKKADILRGIDHTWSRQWVDKTVKPQQPPEHSPSE